MRSKEHLTSRHFQSQAKICETLWTIPSKNKPSSATYKAIGWLLENFMGAGGTLTAWKNDLSFSLTFTLGSFGDKNCVCLTHSLTKWFIIIERT
jgi:hypothetical protein